MFLFQPLCKLQISLIINHLSFLTACFKLQKFKNELRKNREKLLGAASEGSSKTKKKEVYHHYLNWLATYSSDTFVFEFFNTGLTMKFVDH